jgi:CheY-like chemotaxis protein
MRLVILDDNRHCRESLALLMRAMGHQVPALARGDEVQDEVAHSPVDLFFVDLPMPCVDGY